MKTILLEPNPAPAAGPQPVAAAPNATAALTPDAAGQNIARLKTALAAAETVAKVLLADPHFRQCPFVAAIHGPIVTGIERIEHLLKWLQSNPVK